MEIDDKHYGQLTGTGTEGRIEIGVRAAYGDLSNTRTWERPFTFTWNGGKSPDSESNGAGLSAPPIEPSPPKVK